MSKRTLRFFVFSVFFIAIVASVSAVASAQSATPALVKSFDDAKLQWAPCPDIFPKGCEVTVLFGDPAGGRSDVFLRVPAKYRFPSHWHTSPEHMILVNGELKVAYDGQQPATIRRGNYSYGPAKLPHTAECVKGPCVLFIAFESPIDAELTARSPE